MWTGRPIQKLSKEPIRRLLSSGILTRTGTLTLLRSSKKSRKQLRPSATSKSAPGMTSIETRFSAAKVRATTTTKTIAATSRKQIFSNSLRRVHGRASRLQGKRTFTRFSGICSLSQTKKRKQKKRSVKNTKNTLILVTQIRPEKRSMHFILVGKTYRL